MRLASPLPSSVPPSPVAQPPVELADPRPPSLPPRAVDRLLYFVHALPDDTTSLSLAELHDVLHGYLHRHASELVDLAHEREARSSWRKTEGKGKRETELEELRKEETSEYRSGFGAFPLASTRARGPLG